MSAPGKEGMIQVGVDILKTTVSDKTKRILLQTGDNTGEGQVEAEGVELYQQPGLASIPAEAEKGKSAAQGVIIRRGGVDACIGIHDLRGLSLYGALKPGETCIYAAGPDGKAQARILLKSDGGINIFTKKDNSADGKGMGIFVNADGSISVASHNGAGFLIKSDASIVLFNSAGAVHVKADGSIKLASGAKVEISGASVTLGGVAALPVAIAPHVLTAITALQVEIAAVAAALVACMNIPGPILPPHGTAAAAATTAVGVAAGILGGISSLIPAKQTSAQ